VAFNYQRYTTYTSVEFVMMCNADEVLATAKKEPSISGLKWIKSLVFKGIIYKTILKSYKCD